MKIRGEAGGVFYIYIYIYGYRLAVTCMSLHFLSVCGWFIDDDDDLKKILCIVSG